MRSGETWRRSSKPRRDAAANVNARHWKEGFSVYCQASSGLGGVSSDVSLARTGCADFLVRQPTPQYARLGSQSASDFSISVRRELRPARDRLHEHSSHDLGLDSSSFADAQACPDGARRHRRRPWSLLAEHQSLGTQMLPVGAFGAASSAVAAI